MTDWISCPDCQEIDGDIELCTAHRTPSYRETPFEWKGVTITDATLDESGRWSVEPDYYLPAALDLIDGMLALGREILGDADVVDEPMRLIPAQLAIRSDADGNVTEISVLPNEADAGYFGPRETPEFWDAVGEYLAEIAVPTNRCSHCDAQLVDSELGKITIREHRQATGCRGHRDAEYPLRWEG